MLIFLQMQFSSAWIRANRSDVFTVLIKKSPIQADRIGDNNAGGKGGIRTHGTLLRFTAFPMLPVQPLLHLSAKLKKLTQSLSTHSSTTIRRLGSSPTTGSGRRHSIVAYSQVYNKPASNAPSIGATQNSQSCRRSPSPAPTTEQGRCFVPD